MISRRLTLLALIVAAGLGLSGAVKAADAKPFTQTAFEEAKAAGKPVLIEVTAPWCSVCKAQKPILADLTASPRFKNLIVFQVDFDSQKDVLRQLNVQRQSTLITYKGTQEVGRSTGDTNKASIEGLLSKAI
jgi:thioredoxin-like negative regulator of GroEL